MSKAAKEKDSTLREAATREAEEAQVEVDSILVPVVPLRIADDASVEAIAQQMIEQGGRIAVMSPEGDPLDIMAGRYSRRGKPNFGVFLRGHAGDPLVVHRIGRHGGAVRCAVITLGLCVQPEVVRGLASIEGGRGQGLQARFLYSLPRSLTGMRWSRDAVPMPRTVSDGYAEIIRSLLEIPDTMDETGELTPRTISLAHEALQRLLDFQDALEPRLAVGEDLAVISDWANKLCGAIARIAGLLHAAEHCHLGPEAVYAPIPRSAVENAILIGEYFLAHAQAAFRLMGADTAVEDAKTVLAGVRRRGDRTLTRRDLHRRHQAQFPRSEELDPVLRILVDLGYLQELPRPEGRPGRPPSPTYAVNPLCLESSAEGSVSSVTETRHVETQGTGLQGCSVHSVTDSEEPAPGDDNFDAAIPEEDPRSPKCTKPVTELTERGEQEGDDSPSDEGEPEAFEV